MLKVILKTNLLVTCKTLFHDAFWKAKDKATSKICKEKQVK